MKRRGFIAGLAAAGFTCGAPASAANGVAHIGVLGVGSRQQNGGLVEILRAGLAALGWQDGANLVLIDRWAEDRAERLPGLAAELLTAGSDLLVAVGTPATLAAAQVTPVIPIL